jgi:hypothetical protein
MWLRADVAGVHDGIHTHTTAGDWVVRGEITTNDVLACLHHLGHPVLAARGVHLGVEVRRHITQAGTAILRSRGEGAVEKLRFIVKGTARDRDQLLESDIAELQMSRELTRQDVTRIIRGQGGDRVSCIS